MKKLFFYLFGFLISIAFISCSADKSMLSDIENKLENSIKNNSFIQKVNFKIDRSNMLIELELNKKVEKNELQEIVTQIKSNVTSDFIKEVEKKYSEIEKNSNIQTLTVNIYISLMCCGNGESNLSYRLNSSLLKTGLFDTWYIDDIDKKIEKKSIDEFF